MPKVTPWLWFDTQGEEAAEFYTSVFPSSKIVEVTRYGSANPQQEGTVMTVIFDLDGQRFGALNGGPQYTLSSATTRGRSTTTGRRCRRAAKRGRAAG
jgi:predicted 3-demethylubiquinone-9 3-methyltransferase (glyoxalase superfamily)